jgi:hypothetical protein
VAPVTKYFILIRIFLSSVKNMHFYVHIVDYLSHFYYNNNVSIINRQIRIECMIPGSYLKKCRISGRKRVNFL